MNHTTTLATTQPPIYVAPGPVQQNVQPRIVVYRRQDPPGPSNLSNVTACAAIIFIGFANGSVGVYEIIQGMPDKDWTRLLIGAAALGYGVLQCGTGVYFGSQLPPISLTIANIAALMIGTPLSYYIATFQVALPLVKASQDYLPVETQVALGAVAQMATGMAIDQVLVQLSSRLVSGACRIVKIAGRTLGRLGGFMQGMLGLRHNSDLATPLLVPTTADERSHQGSFRSG